MKGLDVIAPTIIKQAAFQIDQIVQRRMQQIINQGGQQVEKTAPKIIKGAIEEVMLGKIKKYLQNSFILTFTFIFM